MGLRFVVFYLSEPCYTKLLGIAHNPAMKKAVIVNALELLNDSDFQDYERAKELSIFDNLYNFIIGRESVTKFTVRLSDSDVDVIHNMIDRFRVKTYSDVLTLGIYLLWSKQDENRNMVDDVLKKMEIIRRWVRDGI